MAVLNKLASALDRGDEVPNQVLAKELAETEDLDSIGELADNLSNSDKAIRSDCIKVLYEIGDLKPKLISPYVSEFIKLLHSRDNRLVWGGMTALGTIADQTAAEIGRQVDVIIESTDRGSVITQDWGIRVLAQVAAKDKVHEQTILSFLKSFLQKCAAKDLPRHAESCVVAFNTANRGEFISILEAKKPSLKPAQAKRLEKVIKQMEAL